MSLLNSSYLSSFSFRFASSSFLLSSSSSATFNLASIYVHIAPPIGWLSALLLYKAHLLIPMFGEGEDQMKGQPIYRFQGDDYTPRTNPSQEEEDDANKGTSIIMSQGSIIRSRAKKLQALITHIQAMVTSTKDIVEDVRVLSYMLCKVEFQDEDALNAF
ncbi:uncharacterized protein LOC120087799 [Benincasa hispida]|uniref:uncharacterized protein LOC120087799 n=1 Tax=Benincasa hispida TaxID=102211 RepID=UPI0018FFFEC5|nr:uncharacterized protein LOC120087799 [Benincasa hispida]